ncbi:MAG: hypothetical protein HQ509_05150, partial [Candidatus Marinimicrobia bacterium]|nr:hypothetical protein [Candidatus Neomarinimicrobiota bacterium]
MRIFFVIQVFIMATIYSQSGLIAYYPFNGNASDESGNGNNGTVYGATLTSDRFGNGDSAYSFDGDNDYIEISNSTSLESAEAISFSLFYQAPDSGGPAEGRILNKDDQYLGDPDRSYYLRLDWIGDSTYKFYWYVYTTSGVHTQISYETSLHPNNWYHIAGIYDGNVHQFYFNNEMIEEIVVNEPRQTGNSPLYIGRLNYGGEYLSGKVDDVYIFDGLLTAEDVDSLYHFGGWDLQTNEGLVAHYPFNGNANDESGNGLHGIPIGVTPTADRYGIDDQAYSFDGTDDYIHLPLDDVFNINSTDQKTITFWLNVDIGASETGVIMSRFYQSPGWDPRWSIVYNIENKIHIQIQDGTTGDENYMTPVASIIPGIWQLFAITFDRINEISDVYIDTNMVISHSIVKDGDFANDMYPGIGAHDETLYNGTVGGFFKGKLDDIRIYDDILSVDDIRNLFLAASLDTSLIAYYPFNGNANDESGNENDGNVNGAILTTDRFGNTNSAYSFDGVDDYIQVPYDPSLQPTEQLTVSIFALLSEYSSYQAFVSNHAPGGWAIWVKQDSVGIDIQFPANEDRIVARYSLENIPVNSWFNVAGVYNGSGIGLYINGELKTEIPFNGPISYLYNNDIHIGAHVNSGSWPFLDGIIDDIHIYNRALSYQEIDSLYHLGGWNTHETGTMTDIDGNEYQTVKIGDQWWMAENLKVTHYRNGDPIPTGHNSTEWAGLTTAAYT